MTPTVRISDRYALVAFQRDESFLGSFHSGRPSVVYYLCRVIREKKMGRETREGEGRRPMKTHARKELTLVSFVVTSGASKEQGRIPT